MQPDGEAASATDGQPVVLRSDLGSDNDTDPIHQYLAPTWALWGCHWERSANVYGLRDIAWGLGEEEECSKR